MVYYLAPKSSGQLIPIRTFTLPSGLNESSGLAIYKGLLYTHNDGGNPNEVYALDTNALLKQTYTIQNASNLDWEAMQITSAGDLLIGDIGNNGNNRQNLRFYWIKRFPKCWEQHTHCRYHHILLCRPNIFPPVWFKIAF